MTDSVEPITVTILDSDYRIACPEEERGALSHSVRTLNDRMRRIRDSGKVIGVERVAVMAALNMAHELLRHQAEKDDYVQTVNARIQRLQDRIQGVLERDGAQPGPPS